jgi:hypothetical protein
MSDITGAHDPSGPSGHLPIAFGDGEERSGWRMHCCQFWDFPAFPVFPTERLVWRRKRRPYRLGPYGEPSRVRLR